MFQPDPTDETLHLSGLENRYAEHGETLLGVCLSLRKTQSVQTEQGIDQVNGKPPDQTKIAGGISRIEQVVKKNKGPWQAWPQMTLLPPDRPQGASSSKSKTHESVSQQGQQSRFGE